MAAATVTVAATTDTMTEAIPVTVNLHTGAMVPINAPRQPVIVLLPQRTVPRRTPPIIKPHMRSTTAELIPMPPMADTPSM